MRKFVYKDNQIDIINKTIEVLKSGGLVIYPSDTVYGALVDATNEEAVKKLIKFKARPPGKPISVFAGDLEMLKQLVKIDLKQLKIIEKILPGPFTVILDSNHKVSKLLESEKGTLGVRLPLYPLINQLTEKFGRPITATSANLSGYSPHYSIDSLLNSLPQQKKQLIDLIVDAGKLPRNKPSTVVDLTQTKIKILRRGEIEFKNTKTYFSQTPKQTKKIAGFLVERLIREKITKPIVFIIEGELGVGKTVFVKGIGELLGINNIISPSFVIYYEYQLINQPLDRLIHLDLYHIEEAEEFCYLGIENYLKPKNLLCIEWGEKVGELINQLKRKGKIIYVKMKYINEREREIRVNF